MVSALRRLMTNYMYFLFNLHSEQIDVEGELIGRLDGSVYILLDWMGERTMI